MSARTTDLSTTFVPFLGRGCRNLHHAVAFKTISIVLVVVTALQYRKCMTCRLGLALRLGAHDNAASWAHDAWSFIWTSIRPMFLHIVKYKGRVVPSGGMSWVYACALSYLNGVLQRPVLILRLGSGISFPTAAVI